MQIFSFLVLLLLSKHSNVSLVFLVLFLCSCSLLHAQQNPCDAQSWLWAQTELQHIPPAIYVFLVLNFKDQAAHWQVTNEQVRRFVEVQTRDSIFYLEASLCDGYGLDEMRTCFAVPFIRLQVRSSRAFSLMNTPPRLSVISFIFLCVLTCVYFCFSLCVYLYVYVSVCLHVRTS